MNTMTTCSTDQVSADAVLAEKGRSFHWARRLLGRTHAERATRLYAFCRHLDDLADEATLEATARADLLAVRSALDTGRSGDPWVRDGLRLFSECRIAPELPGELIHGLVSDLEPVRIPDESALLRYCYRVAGTVGLMMCGVLDVQDRKAFPHAIDLGIAMQLTNICRDIAEDAAADRRYLPATWVGDVEPDEVLSPSEALRFRLRSAVEALLAMADRYYQSGECGLAFLPFRARLGILAASRVYRAIGSELRKRNHAFWLGRVVIPDRKKAALTAQALLSMPWRPSFWRHPSWHEQDLHTALTGLPGVGGDNGN